MKNRPARYCRDCRYFYRDDRSTLYIRSLYCFCQKKGVFFSRNYRIGEGTRIGEGDTACPDFQEKSQ